MEQSDLGRSPWGRSVMLFEERPQVVELVEEMPDVRLGPQPDELHRSKSTLFNHLVCAPEERKRKAYTECFSSFQIYDELDFRDLFDG